MKSKYLPVVGSLIFLLVSCGPSPEQVATLTAAAWTATPRPTSTPTITPSPTPVPYDLTVTVIDEAGAPIADASITFPESGFGEAVASDESGKHTWKLLPGSEVTLSVTAQGYLPASQSSSLERGPSEISVVMKRDPYGLLASTACAVGESLLFMDDFQSGTTILAHHTQNGGAPAPLGPAVDEDGDTVLIHDASILKGDYSSYLKNNPDGSTYQFGEAVLRLRFMESQDMNLWLNWISAPPSEFGGITTGQTDYSIGFTANRHLIIIRNIYDTTYKTVFNIGKRDLGDKILIIRPNLWHYLEISTYQGRLQVWLDGESVADVLDDMPLPAGGFSLGGNDLGIAYFDAISVCGLNAPFTSLAAPVPVPSP